MAPANDIRILKVVIFSKAVTSLVSYIGDRTGLFKPIEGSDETRLVTVEYVLAVIGCFFISFCYIFRPNSMPPSLFKTVTRGMAMSESEMRCFDFIRAMHELESKHGYKYGAIRNH